MGEIIIPGSGKHNNHSKTDGIGAAVLSIPPAHHGIIQAEPAFDWVCESNEGVTLFCKLNPQYDDRYRAKFTRETLPKTIINKDGGIYSLIERKFIGTTKAKGVTQ